MRRIIAAARPAGTLLSGLLPFVLFETIRARIALSIMKLSGNSHRRITADQRVRSAPPPKTSVGRWYPIVLKFQYRAYSTERLVHTGAGETIEISSRSLRLRIPEDLPPQVAELDLAIAWPVPLYGVTPLQWTVKAKPVWRSPGWIFVCIASYEFRTAGARGRQAMAACG